MRTSKEMATEVWRRVDENERREKDTKRKIYSVIAVAACLAAVIGLSLAMPYFPVGDAAADSGQYTASLFSGGTAGGYVLVAVIAFALGAGVSLFCVKMLKRK
jgi:hypothetical protein